MRARPEDFLTSRSRLQPPSEGKLQKPHSVAAPQTRTLEGHLHLGPDRRTGLAAGRRSAVVVPCLRLPAAPPPSTLHPAPPHRTTPHSDSERRQRESDTVSASPSCLLPPPPPPSPPPPPPPPPPPQKQDKASEGDKEDQPAAVEPSLGPPGSTLSASPSSLSLGSLSDFSRPPSSLFSRSTDLSSGRSSVLCDRSIADIGDSDPEGSVCLSPPQPSPVEQSPLTSHPPAASNLHQSFNNTTTPTSASTSTSISTSTPPLYEPPSGQTEPLSPRPTPAVSLNSDGPLSSSQTTDAAENLHPEKPVDSGIDPSLDSHRGGATPAFPSATWSSCPSPLWTARRSGSGAKLTPSPPASRLESHRWPVLPPISPIRGRSAASPRSELSCTRSRMFDELEAIAPLSASSRSLDTPADSSGCPSPDTELSPGLAALTVGCDSGNLGSLSRVQLLLLDRPAPENLPSPPCLEEEFFPEQDWSDLQYDPGLTSAGSVRRRFWLAIFMAHRPESVVRRVQILCFSLPVRPR
ncbi:uncharacterized protein [Brachyistius frenatus]|uniref:uncharacterized protein n=1 Tax=Brachyistius frenatus TaxID=100188 RepID=UPI0037E9817E